MSETTKQQLPTDDKRWKLVNRAMRQYGYNASGLIETLHAVQDAFGYLDFDILKHISKALNVPLSKVYGVATFYHHFTLKPLGDHTCVVCLGTACYIKGVPELLEALEDEAHVKLGETTEDKKLSTLGARCVGACGLAPVVTFDGSIEGKITPDTFREKLKELLS